VSSAERRWVAVVGAAVLLVTLLPLPVAAAVAPSGEGFGGFVVEARDSISYVAKAREGLQGHWLYHDPYTSEAQPETAIYLPYLALGQLDRLLHLPLEAELQVARLVLAAALLWAVYLLAAQCFDRVRWRRTAFLLTVFGGGLGVIGHGSIVGYHLVSLDREVSGTVGLETMSVAPHIVLACLGCAWLALLWVRHADSPRKRDLAATLAWTVIISAAYPQVAAMWAVIGAVAFALRPSRGRAAMTAAIALGAAPYVAYGLGLQASNPVFKAWPPQGDIDVGDPLSYLLWGHLLMLPFVLVATVQAARRPRERWLELALVWIAVSAVLMYTPGLPHLLQRVYYGSFIPFAVATTAGVVEAWSRRWVRRLVPLMGVAGLAVIVESFAIPLQHLDDYALYFPRDERAVLQRLQELRPGGGALVMNSYLSGLYVPAIGGQDTYVGFPFETLDTAAKADSARTFYRLADAAALRDAAARLKLSYVLYGRYERGYGGADPGALAGWRVAARQGDALLYSTR